jgi:lysozyme
VRLRLAAFSFTFAVAALGACSDPATENVCVDESASPLRVCAPGATVKGIDVSYYQGTIDWAKVKAAGKVYAFVRVSDGLDYPDSQFARNWTETKKNGVLRGVYQYFRPGKDPIQQAELLLTKLTAAGGMKSDDLPVVLDVETADGQSGATVVARAKQWLAHVEKATGKKPIVYTAAFMSQTIGSGLAAYPLWVANYGATCPSMPTGWSAWKFWQYSSTGAVAGISGNVDLNDWNGTLAELKTFAGATNATPDAGAPPPVSIDAGTADPIPPAPSGNGAAMGEGDKPPSAPPPAPCGP